MAKKTLCPKIRYGEDSDSLQPVARCPACNRDYDVALILPCSHTMCGHCVVHGERRSSDRSPHRGVGLSACSVLCPCCQRHVELPCWAWSSATSCLPKHPTLSPARVSGETGAKDGASQHHLQHPQQLPHCHLPRPPDPTSRQQGRTQADLRPWGPAGPPAGVG
ncbi:Hypothetical protein SMAX5B_008451 [Scophthalmus maximus]|uniref:RING-type domain-containing protein n=1 Tax=Scophthalmus maximus TaxID=52904 RepID=A0A2U9B467_SCOMX|nr:Hypothetical protein SMAX5B_008451 [Scophthalmus maximus]